MNRGARGYPLSSLRGSVLCQLGSFFWGPSSSLPAPPSTPQPLGLHCPLVPLSFCWCQLSSSPYHIPLAQEPSLAGRPGQ